MHDHTPTPTNPSPRAARAGVAAGPWWSAPEAIARGAVAIAVVLGVLSLVGWLVEVPELRALGSASRAAMNPTTAACFVALGSAMWIVANNEFRRGRDIAGILTVLVLTIGLAQWYSLSTGIDLKLDTLLFRDAMAHTGDGRHNRMSPNSAINFALLGGGLLLQLRRSRFASAVSQVIAVLVLFSAEAALIAHMYRSGWFASIGVLNRMAMPSAFAFAALSIGSMALSSRSRPFVSRS